MRLSKEQLQTFYEDGVLVAEGVVTDEDLAPVLAECEAWVDRRARELHDAGQISDLAAEADFEHRFSRLYAQCPAIAEGIDIMQMRGPATFTFLRSANLLEAVECLVGPEITCSPIQHLRAKPPASAEG